MAVIEVQTPMPGVAGLPGIRFRQFRGVDLDIAGMAEANQAARTAAGEVEPVDVEEMRSTYAHLERCDPDQDICIVEAEGAIAGYARVFWDDLHDGSREYWAVRLMSPVVRSPEVARALIAWTDERRLAIAAGHRAAGEALDRPASLGTDCFDADTDGTALLREAGYEPYRRFASLVRPALEAIDDNPLPEGIEARPIVREDGLMRRIFDAEVDAFSEEFNSHDPSEAEYARFLEEPGQDLTLWAIGFDGDEIAGGVRANINVTADGTREGWLDPVWVRSGWRRRGLARALISRTLEALRDKGADRAALGADLDSPNRTLALYESCGFRLASSTTSWRKPVIVHGAAR